MVHDLDASDVVVPHDLRGRVQQLFTSVVINSLNFHHVRLLDARAPRRLSPALPFGRYQTGQKGKLRTRLVIQLPHYPGFRVQPVLQVASGTVLTSQVQFVGAFTDLLLAPIGVVRWRGFSFAIFSAFILTAQLPRQKDRRHERSGAACWRRSFALDKP